MRRAVPLDQTSEAKSVERWQIGSRGRVLHGIVLVFAQVLAAMIGLVGVGRMVGVDIDNMFAGGLRALVVVAAMGTLQVVGVIGIGLLAWGRVTLRSLGWRRDGFRDVLFGLGGALAMIASALAVVALFGGSVFAVGRDLVRFTLLQRAEMLLIGLFAGFTEETLFRGYLQPALASKLGLAPGIAVGAGIFCIYHAPFMPHVPALLAKLAYGIVLGCLRGRDRSLVAPAVAHFGFWQVMGFA